VEQLRPRGVGLRKALQKPEVQGVKEGYKEETGGTEATERTVAAVAPVGLRVGSDRTEHSRYHNLSANSRRQRRVRSDSTHM